MEKGDDIDILFVNIVADIYQLRTVSRDQNCVLVCFVGAAYVNRDKKSHWL